MILKHIIEVGVTKVDVTPEYGTQIGGDIGRYRPVEEVKDHLYARIILLKSQNRTLCVIASDTDCVNRDIGLILRGRIAKLINGQVDDVMIHCSQSHSAPAVGAFLDDFQNLLAPELRWVCGDTPAYNEFFIKQIINGVEDAMKQFVPTKIKFARGVNKLCAFNRRFKCEEKENKKVLRYEGPIDPEVSLTLFEDLNSKPVAGLLHYTCHPTHGYPHRYISADWPGLWSERVSDMLGHDCVVGCFNGACGNIGPRDHSKPNYESESNLEEMLKGLTQSAGNLIDDLKEVDGTCLKRSSRTINIPWLRPTEEVLSKARLLLEKHPEPMFLDEAKERISWDWVLAIRDLDKLRIIEKNPDYEFEIQVFRIGDIAFVGWPGEPFVEAQLEVKLKSRIGHLVIGHQSNGRDCGYLPTEKAIRNGGYEVDIGRKLAPEALEEITRETIEIVNSLFPEFD